MTVFAKCLMAALAVALWMAGCIAGIQAAGLIHLLPLLALPALFAMRSPSAEDESV